MLFRSSATLGIGPKRVSELPIGLIRVSSGERGLIGKNAMPVQYAGPAKGGVVGLAPRVLSQTTYYSRLFCLDHVLEGDLQLHGATAGLQGEGVDRDIERGNAAAFGADEDGGRADGGLTAKSR